MKASGKSVSGKTIKIDCNTNHKQFQEKHNFISITTYEGDSAS